ncbi:MAG: nitroreductase [Dehalococcoidales bacterium]|nr:nitroreductase [Dehalococcoidales bacterium]
MHVADALTARYTCRAFKPDPVNLETMASVLDAALRAPSWANTQPWELFVATGKVLNRIRARYLENYHNGVMRNLDLQAPQSWPAPLRARIEDLGAKRFAAMGVDREDSAARQKLGEQNFRLFGAPAVVYLCMQRSLGPWSMFDMGSLSQSIMLAAQEHGLDSAPAVMLVAFPDILRAELGIPEDLAIAMGIALGYGNAEHIQNRYRSPRRSIQDVVRFRE